MLTARPCPSCRLASGVRDVNFLAPSIRDSPAPEGSSASRNLTSGTLESGGGPPRNFLAPEIESFAAE